MTEPTQSNPTHPIIAHLWVMTLGSSAASLLVRRGVPAMALSAGVSALAAHAALHQLTASSAALAGSGSALLDNWLVILTAAWAGSLLLVGLATAVRRSGRPLDEDGLGQAWEGTVR